MENKSKIYKVWTISTLVLIMAFLISIALIIIYIDPFFHYHAPREEFAYLINHQRYQNDGIVRIFEYDGIITGSSMTENFKASEADRLFNAKFVKVPFQGGPYKEVNDNLKRAYSSGKNIKYVIRALDEKKLMYDKDFQVEISDSFYIRNDNLFDDINYVLNKDVLLNNVWWGVITYTINGNKTTSFDEYANWNSTVKFGADIVLESYALTPKSEEIQVLSDETMQIIIENVKQNVTGLADEHPETTFYYFFPPYSICEWDIVNNNGQTNLLIDAEKLAIEEILKHPNIKLYSFNNNFELVCNLDNYKDTYHYGEWINSWMLEKMYNEEYLLTEDNYQQYIDDIRKFYNSYDYDSLHELKK